MGVGVCGDQCRRNMTPTGGKDIQWCGRTWVWTNLGGKEGDMRVCTRAGMRAEGSDIHIHVRV